MRVSNLLYTYPVLSNSGLREDYVEASDFSVRIEKIQSGSSEVSLGLKASLEDVNLSKLLQSGMLRVVCHIESSLSSFRDIIELDTYDMSTSFVVDATRMRGILEISTFIVAARDIENFTSTTFGEFYSGTYNIDKGNILGFAPTIEIEIEPDDIDKSPTQSIIKVNPYDRREMSVDITGNYIIVYVPKTTYSGYKQLSAMGRPHHNLSLMALILPALMVAITEIKNDEGDSDTKVWARAIREKLKAGGRGSDTSQYDPLSHAQFLLNNPADDLFTPIIESQSGEL